MKKPEEWLVAIFVYVLVIGCCVNFFDIVWGTGVWLGEIAFSWAVFFFVFCMVSAGILFLFHQFLTSNHKLTDIKLKIIDIRETLIWLRWVFIAPLFALPIWLLQFTELGIILQGGFLRLALWMIQILILSTLLTFDRNTFIDFKTIFFVVMLTGVSFSIFATFRFVTSYPFALGWSEGNRLWDYSVMFGRDSYIYPVDQEIPVLLDVSRQFVGGIPFIYSDLTIEMERLWVSLTGIFPYFLLGLATFRFVYREKEVWLTALLWTYLFIKQGPIHPPLVLCAIIVSLAWRSKPWLAILLVFLATYFAYISRYTWTFAPVLWFFLLEIFANQVENNAKHTFAQRFRSLIIYLFGGAIFSAFLLIIWMGIRSDWTWNFFNFLSNLEINPEFVVRKITDQPLLWYRLFPNETYGNGILVGLFLAITPLLSILFYLFKSKLLIGISWVKIILILLPLVAFLIVGLIVSTKIGGGADLHNMDMFLIGMFFISAVVFKNIAKLWIDPIVQHPFWVRCSLILLVAIPAITPLQEMRSYKNSTSTSRLIALTDVPNERALDLYPPDHIIEESLNSIEAETQIAIQSGDVLFMDQRQLLTFGFIKDIPLIPEYDKKSLIEYAMTERLPYFENFYKDLENRRFSLIITQPLNTPKKGSEDGFGEENNAWVKWVAQPLLCYYEIKQTLLEVNVQLLSPKDGPVDCADILP